MVLVVVDQKDSVCHACAAGTCMYRTASSESVSGRYCTKLSDRNAMSVAQLRVRRAPLPGPLTASLTSTGARPSFRRARSCPRGSTHRGTPSVRSRRRHERPSTRFLERRESLSRRSLAPCAPPSWPFPPTLCASVLDGVFGHSGDVGCDCPRLRGDVLCSVRCTIDSRFDLSWCPFLLVLPMHTQWS